MNMNERSRYWRQIIQNTLNKYPIIYFKTGKPASEFPKVTKTSSALYKININCIFWRTDHFTFVIDAESVVRSPKHTLELFFHSPVLRLVHATLVAFWNIIKESVSDPEMYFTNLPWILYEKKFIAKRVYPGSCSSVWNGKPQIKFSYPKHDKSQQFHGYNQFTWLLDLYHY